MKEVGKKGSHVGIIISFSLFILFLLSVFLLINPALKERGEKQPVLESINQKLLENFSSNMTLTLIKLMNATCVLTESGYPLEGSSWKYRRPVNVSVSSGTTAKNYQTKIILNSSNVGANFNWTRNCSDLRFVNGSNNAQLDFWIESCSSSSQNATIWVEIDNNISTSAYTIYIYYGNNGAASASSISNTMDAGLRYKYYDGKAFNTYQGTNVDTNTNHAWAEGAVTIVGNAWENQADTVSIIWEGWIVNKGSGSHTFYVTSDDGQRLYVPNSSLIVNNWVDQSDTERSAAYSFSAPVSIRYEWYENGGGATAKLGWAPADASGKVYPIPSAYLRSRKNNSVEPTSRFGSEETNTTPICTYSSGGEPKYIGEDYNPDEKTCLILEGGGWKSGEKIVVKNANNERINSTINSSEIKVDWTEEAVFLKVYSSLESFREMPLQNNDCATPIEDSHFFISSIKTENYIFESNIIKLEERYNSSYEDLKEDLNIPLEEEFGFSFINSTGIAKIEVGKTPSSANIYTKNNYVLYVDNQSNILSGEIIVKVW